MGLLNALDQAFADVIEAAQQRSKDMLTFVLEITRPWGPTVHMLWAEARPALTPALMTIM